MEKELEKEIRTEEITDLEETKLIIENSQDTHIESDGNVTAEYRKG